MANQMIALQARAPQNSFIGDAVRQNSQLINMMTQQAAAQRQAQQAQQAMDIAQAQEDRAAALAKPQLAKAESEATTEQVKAVSAFLDLSIEGMMQARSPEQAARVGEFLKQQFPDSWARQAVDETLSTMPSDPAQFEPWRKQALFQSMDAKDQLSQKFEQMTTGAETWMTATPEYAGAPQGLEATEVAGTRVQAPQDITYVKLADGSIMPMPKQTTPGLVGGSRGGDTFGRMIGVESGGKQFSASGAPLTSSAGAIGVAQVMPKTAPEAAALAGLPFDENRYRTDREYNLALGRAYFNKQLADFGDDRLAAAAYNAGPGAVRRALRVGGPDNWLSKMPAETQDYVAKVFGGGAAGAGGIQMGKPIPGTGDSAPKTTEDERKIASNVRNMISAARELAQVVKEDASAMAPGGGEYAASMIPFYGSEAAQWAQSGGRQRFNSAMEKMLAAVTFINTGAGVSETQMNSYRKSYFPTIQDTPRTRQQKMLGAIQFIRDAKVRAGAAWTPELDTALNSLQKLFGTAATYGSKPASGGSGFRVTKVAD